METYVAPAPVELAAQAQGLLARARAAVDALKRLGVPDTEIAAIDRRLTTALSAPDALDGVTTAAPFVEELRTQVGQAAFDGAASAFVGAQGDATTVIDLGSVSEDVAVAAGYGCVGTIG